MVADRLDLLGQSAGLVEVVAVDLDIDGVGRHTASGGGRYIEVGDLRILLQFLAHDFGYLKDRTFAFVFLRGTDGHVDGVVHRRGEQRTDTGIVVRTGRGGYEFYLRHQLPDTSLQLTSRLERLLDTRTSLQLHLDGEASHILLLHKVRTDLAGKNRQQREAKDDE